jgi:hypothetical protein
MNFFTCVAKASIYFDEIFSKLIEKEIIILGDCNID